MFEGIRVLELGTWVMLPAAAAVLADYGAEVIKVEHPRTGDPGRGLVTGGVSPQIGSSNVFTEQHNRGKRSVGIDVAKPEGREVLYRIAATCDVFMTNMLPDARRKYNLDVEDIRRVNPNIIYVRADGVGLRGPESGKPGYDFSVFWARSGFLDAVTGRKAERPVSPRPGFGDRTAAMSLAFGVATALFKRERSGHAAVVEASLLSAAVWSNASDIVYSAALGRNFTDIERPNTNPLGLSYHTSDNRWITLTMLESDRWWPELLRHIEREDLAQDPRFVDHASRAANAEACIAELTATFASRPISEWREKLRGMRAPFEIVQDQMDIINDPQVNANGYLTEIDHPSGQKVKVAAAPVQFDSELLSLTAAPEVGANTEEVLLEIGMDWDELIALKDANAIT